MTDPAYEHFFPRGAGAHEVAARTWTPPEDPGAAARASADRFAAHQRAGFAAMRDRLNEYLSGLTEDQDTDIAAGLRQLRDQADEAATDPNPPPTAEQEYAAFFGDSEPQQPIEPGSYESFFPERNKP